MKNKKHANNERYEFTSSIEIASIPDLDNVKEISKSHDIKVEKSLSYGEVEVIVSNSAKDRQGESIVMEGIDITQVKRNPVVLWGHQYSNLPIGQITKIWKSQGNLMARIKLDYDIYEFADTVYKMIVRGTINAVSIGGIVKQWNADYTVVEKLEMLELSVVPIGAHPDALVTAKSLGIKKAELQRQYEEFINGALVDKFKNLSNNEIELHVKSLKALVSALESSIANSTDTENHQMTEKSEVRIKKLIVARQAAKQCDKQAELIIAAISNKLKTYK